jgi:hypothetical protein
MAFSSCDLATINAAVPGSLQEMSDLEKQALLVLYLYRQKNPATSGQTIPADTLLASAKCLDCGVPDSTLKGFEVWMQRQAAIDGGANVGAFVAGDVRSEMKCLTCLPMHRLRAIELLLRCQVS